MVIAEKQAFITRPVADLPPGNSVGRPASALTAFFRELPAGEAVFVPAEGWTLEAIAASVSSRLGRATLGRRIKSRRDRDANGVWFWWEPKEGSRDSGR